MTLTNKTNGKTPQEWISELENSPKKEKPIIKFKIYKNWSLGIKKRWNHTWFIHLGRLVIIID